jgi:hypothetical protein
LAAVAADSAAGVRPVAGDGSTPIDADASRDGRGRLSRLVRHLWTGPIHIARAFPAEAYLRIEQAIDEGEQRHRAELRFAVESSLDAGAVWSRTSPRERAVQVFAEFGIWDTEEDNGVLLYLLWADHAVEVVADRGVARRVDPSVWIRACDVVHDTFVEGRHVEGVLEAIAIINDALAAAYPADGQANDNQLPNRPLVL